MGVSGHRTRRACGEKAARWTAVGAGAGAGHAVEVARSFVRLDEAIGDADAPDRSGPAGEQRSNMGERLRRIGEAVSVAVRGAADPAPSGIDEPEAEEIAAQTDVIIARDIAGGVDRLKAQMRFGERRFREHDSHGARASGAASK